jgi:hypothetical protein
MLVNLQTDVVSYPRRPVSSILNNFVTVLWHYVSPKFCT